MPYLTFFEKIWVCRAILGHNLTICALLYFSREIRLEHPAQVPLRTNKHKQINVYWNIPTFQCDSFKLNFSVLAEKYDIIQNEDDRFRGKYVSILYDPGNFPAILKNGTVTYLRNGGVPQEGNLTNHLLMFENMLKQLIPDKSFSGIGIIDFESWRPIFRQNFGTLTEYKKISIDIEKKRHPFWSESQLTEEATRRFEIAARKFMERTLSLAQKLRPKATWGYYAYPYCFNMSPSNMRQECPKNVIAENDRYFNTRRSSSRTSYQKVSRKHFDWSRKPITLRYSKSKKRYFQSAKTYKFQYQTDSKKKHSNWVRNSHVRSYYSRTKKRLKWLFQHKYNFYPSIYLTNSSHTAIQKTQMIEGRIDESLRIMNSLNVRKNIILYFWYKYQDTNKFLTKEDLFNIFTVLASSNIDGMIIWGSSNDVNNRHKCLELYHYIDDILGPLLSHII